MSYSVVNKEYCKGCLKCVNVCPNGCLGLSGHANKSGYDYVEFKEGSPCIGCALCYMVCPDVAITVHKEK